MEQINEIYSSIDELAARGKISRNRALASWYAINFHGVDEDEALEGAATDGGNDQGIDLIFADMNSEEIVVIQAFCPEKHSKPTPKSKWDAVVASKPYLADGEKLKKAGRPDLAETVLRLRAEHPDFTLSIGLVSLGKATTEIQRSVKDHQDQDDEIEYFFSPAEDIIAKFTALVNSEAGIPKGSIKFAGKFIEDTGEYGRALIGSVTAAELQRLYAEHGNQLFAEISDCSWGVGKEVSTSRS